MHVVGTVFRDGQGRQLLFRGYNAKVTTLFDVTFSDGRVPEETFPDLSETEASRIEQLGWNVLRIPVSWSGLEPHPLQYSHAFLDKLDAVLAMAQQHHFYVLRRHAPGRATARRSARTASRSGPSSRRRRCCSRVPTATRGASSGQALHAGYSFFANANATDGRPLQNAYVAAVQQIVRHVVGNPQVLGYEAFNEPVAPAPRPARTRSTRSFADAVHAIDADAPVLFEPVARAISSTPPRFPTQPWSQRARRRTPCTSTRAGSRRCTPSQAGRPRTRPSLAPSMAHAELERAGWGTPLFVTEFGCDQTLAAGARRG